LDEFTPQTISNLIWAYSTAEELHHSIFQNVADAEVKSQIEFNSQGIANSLRWIDCHLFSLLEPTVEEQVRKCNSPGLANIAWTYAVPSVASPSLFNDDFIQVCLENQDGFALEELGQLCQWQLWQEELKSNIGLPPSLQEKCYEAFISLVPSPPALQDDIISEISFIGLQSEEEMLTKRGYLLDALVKINGKNIGIEVDGPSHFVGRNPT